MVISGRALRWARNKRNWSQQDLAEKVGVTRNAVLSWENEKSAISEDNERKVRAIFGSELEIEPVDVPFESKSESAGDLEEIIRCLAAIKPDIVLQFRRLVRSMDKVPEEDVRFLAHAFSLCLGQVCGKVSYERN